MSRPRGSKNIDRAEFQERMRELECDTAALTVMYATDAVPCRHCDENRKVSAEQLLHQVGCKDMDLFSMAVDDDKRYLCGDCRGTGTQYLDPAVIVKALSTLLDREVPKLASKRVVKDVRRFTMTRLHALEGPALEEAKQRIAAAEADDETETE